MLQMYRNAFATHTIQASPVKIQTLPEPEQHQATKGNKAPQNNPISPLLRPNPLHQPIDPRYLSRSPCDPPLNTAQTLPL